MQEYLYHAEICKTSLYYHARVGMGYDFIPDDLLDLCNWTQNLWNPEKPHRQNAIIQMARDTYKSTAITQSLPSWLLSQNPNLSILLASKVDTNVKNFLTAQTKRFEDEDFIRMFGQWRGRWSKWNDTEVVLDTRTNNRKEPSIRAASSKTSLTSQHYDVIIADDITTMEDMYSPAERNASKRFLRSLFDLIDKKHGLLLLIGTCWHNDDALEMTKKLNEQKIKDGLEPFKVYWRPMVGKDNRPCFSWVTDQFVKQLRADKADARDFAANYLLKPMPDDAQLYYPEKFYYFNYLEFPKDKVETVIMFCDPSLEGTKDNCYSAIVTIAMYDGYMHVVDCNAEQRAPSATINAIEERYLLMRSEFPSADIRPYIEAVLFQKFVQEMAVAQYTENGSNVPLMPMPQHTNKIARITAMEKYVQSGIIKFRSDWKDLPGMKILFDQLQNFPHDYMDAPDAMEGAVSAGLKSSVPASFLI